MPHLTSVPDTPAIALHMFVTAGQPWDQGQSKIAMIHFVLSKYSACFGKYLSSDEFPQKCEHVSKAIHPNYQFQLTEL